ncbi:hypothetical protein C5167_047096 [Papaver somniferum]|uniref:Uncharacterized protein n=1 Tax=Papaver somniferum TaxID=3469 RepID=A0A4Y7LJ94_PAPSO|nr:hypothetical protein C5167_047096 [Papaver somniferum]
MDGRNIKEGDRDKPKDLKDLKGHEDISISKYKT